MDQNDRVKVWTSLHRYLLIPVLIMQIKKYFYRYTGGTQCVSEAYSLDTGKLLCAVNTVYTSNKI
jgi:hypothetical protein